MVSEPSSATKRVENGSTQYQTNFKDIGYVLNIYMILMQKAYCNLNCKCISKAVLPNNVDIIELKKGISKVMKITV